MNRRKRYSAEFKREALKRANEEADKERKATYQFDGLQRGLVEINSIRRRRHFSFGQLKLGAVLSLV